MMKYYVPTKEELHVGFEYEFYYDASDDLSLLLYRKEIVTEDNIEDLINSLDEPDCEDPTIRVKYLDKEDISSLGFKQDEENQLDPNDANGYTFIWSFTNAEDVEIEFTRWNVGNLRANKLGKEAIWHTNIDVKKKGHLRFRGEVKNKSELKKLLTMLHIK